MAMIELSLQSLKEMGGGAVHLAFMKHLARCVLDCIDRPADKKGRKVTLEFEVSPIVVQNGGTIECGGVKGDFKVKSKIPDHRSAEISFTCNTKGQIAFNDLSPENANQATIDQARKDGTVDRLA